MGAAIAAGNHLEKGNWALFVIAAMVIMVINKGSLLFDHINIIFQDSILIIHEIERSNKTSPNRLVIAVNIPAPNDFLSW